MSKDTGVPDENDLTPIGNCRMCQYRMNLLLGGRCTPGDICIAVDSGRQIDRFLRFNPELAPQYLKDGFWERRAIAVRYSPQSALSSMIRISTRLSGGRRSATLLRT